MIPPLEIFRVEKDGALVWCESVSTVEAGKARIDDLAVKTAAQYVIVSISTGHRRIFGISGHLPRKAFPLGDTAPADWRALPFCCQSVAGR